VEAGNGTMDAILMHRRLGVRMVWHRLLQWLRATTVERPHGKDEAMSTWARHRRCGKGLPVIRATLADTATPTGTSLDTSVNITDTRGRGKMRDPPNLLPFPPSLFPARVAMMAGIKWAEGPRTTIAARGPAGAAAEGVAMAGADGVTECSKEAAIKEAAIKEAAIKEAAIKEAAIKEAATRLPLAMAGKN
jgi:hypothetical protein